MGYDIVCKFALCTLADMVQTPLRFFLDDNKTYDKKGTE